MSEKPNILVLLAHPRLNESQVNKALIKQITSLPYVVVHDLYEIYPDFYIDVEKEQALLLQASLIIFQCPMYWYSSPSLMKEWQDVVLERGFARGARGTALRGKDFRMVITTGGPEEAFQRGGANNFTTEELLRPFEQMAHLCGMTYHPPFVVHGAFYLQRDEIELKAEAYRHQLESYVKSHG
ncbi:MAG: NAD(P)H-dependent oxidoreductase [Zetaproteobacteria bacterium]|jgi:glutathione-regulated potassium-efflux system ancillary protein KefG|nr:NAD(P)H-dependent oxidoreductase [Zetaproteobacteria bacterium]